jgi:hypothetical protein
MVDLLIAKASEHQPADPLQFRGVIDGLHDDDEFIQP